jgi:hypothetical protein
MLTALPLVSEGQAQHVSPDDADKIITGLRQVAAELGESVKQFQTDLDREIAQYDHGYRTQDGHRIPGADADLIAGPADLALPTVQKLMATRMIAARKPGYQPIPLTDSDRIQSLIAEARSQVALANNAMRQFLIVSAKELNSRTDAEMRTQRTELLKARNAATEAAKKALAVLPVDLPAGDSPADQVDRTWSLAATALPVGKNDGTRVGAATRPGTPEDVVLPIRVEPGQKITLVREPFRRIAVTDTGREDRQGRRLFYQEEWEQHQGTTSEKRWAVAVNTATGQQTLLRRYEIREFSGELDEVYQSYGRDFASLVDAESPLPPAEPSLTDIASATAEAVRSREELAKAVLDFKAGIREGLTRSNAAGEVQNKPALDDDLPDRFRESLFAIRGHLARAASVLDAEDKVRRAVERASGSAGALEALVAWVSGTALGREGPAGDSRALLEALNRSDTEIAATRSVQRDALAALPPDVSRPEAQFPAFMKDVIVRMRGSRPPSGEHAGTVRCRQEVWRIETSAHSAPQVKRTIALIDIEPKTGNQIRASGEVRYYPVRAGDSLESIYDENAAQ